MAIVHIGEGGVSGGHHSCRRGRDEWWPLFMGREKHFLHGFSFH